jgi:hypothetical protein
MCEAGNVIIDDNGDDKFVMSYADASLRIIGKFLDQVVVKLVRFKQKGQKQASFLAFHKCCQGCLLRGPR